MTSASVRGQASHKDICCCRGDGGIGNLDFGDTGFYWVSVIVFKGTAFVEALGQRKGLEKEVKELV